MAGPGASLGMQLSSLARQLASLPDLSPLHIQLIYPFILDLSIPKFASVGRGRSSSLTPSRLQPVYGGVRACSTNGSLGRQLHSRRGTGVPPPGTDYLEGKATRRPPSFYRLLGSSPATRPAFFSIPDRK